MSERHDPPPPRPIGFPPLIYAATLLLAFGLQWIHPLRFLPGRLGLWVGLPFVAAGVWLAIGARRTFDRAGTTVHPYEAATALVTTGPFRFSRNPMYLAMVVAYLGAGVLMMNSLWALFLLAPLVAVIQLGVIAGEERFLEAAFGDAYRDYRARVRRWL